MTYLNLTKHNFSNIKYRCSRDTQGQLDLLDFQVYYFSLYSNFSGHECFAETSFHFMVEFAKIKLQNLPILEIEIMFIYSSYTC